MVVGYATRLEGALAIHPFPDAKVVAELRAMLASLHGESARSSAWGLTPMGHGLVNDSDYDWENQASVLRMIAGEILAPRGMHLIGRLEAIGEDDVRVGAVVATPSGIVVEKEPDEDPYEDASSWIAWLASTNETERLAGAEMLAGCDAALAVPALARALSDPSAHVRARALESLGEHAENSAAHAREIAGALEDPDPIVRYWATYALGRIGPSADALFDRLERTAETDPADGPRWGAIDAMKRIRR
jgi:hypothetical protein